MPLPSLDVNGDLPSGVQHASLQEILEGFAQSTPQRSVVGMRLARVYELAAATGHVKRFIVFGSFVTSKSEPNDIDVFLIMDNSFELSEVTGEGRLIFEHAAAQAHFGSSVFWLRDLALTDEEQSIAGWQIKRDGTQRGIVEITEA